MLISIVKHFSCDVLYSLIMLALHSANAISHKSASCLTCCMEEQRGYEYIQNNKFNENI